MVLDMPLLDTRKSRDLTGTLIADIVLQLLSYVAQTEREFIHQRQAEGFAAAKARGVRCGQPPMERPPEYESLKKNGNRATSLLAKLLSVWVLPIAPSCAGYANKQVSNPHHGYHHKKPAQEMKELKPKNLNELIKFLLILPLQGAIYFHGKNSVRKVCSRIPKITKAEDVPHFHKWGTASAFLMTQYPSLPTQCFDCTNSDTPSYCNSEI